MLSFWTVTFLVIALIAGIALWAGFLFPIRRREISGSDIPEHGEGNHAAAREYQEGAKEFADAERVGEIAREAAREIERESGEGPRAF